MVATPAPPWRTLGLERQALHAVAIHLHLQIPQLNGSSGSRGRRRRRSHGRAAAGRALRRQRRRQQRCGGGRAAQQLAPAQRRRSRLPVRRCAAAEGGDCWQSTPPKCRWAEVSRSCGAVCRRRRCHTGAVSHCAVSHERVHRRNECAGAERLAGEEEDCAGRFEVWFLRRAAGPAMPVGACDVEKMPQHCTRWP